MPKYNEIDVTADKIFSAIGDKDIIDLTGEKYTSLLNGSTDKQVSLLALKNITIIETTTDKAINFIGDKYLDDLIGLKNIDSLIGDTDKAIDLIADADGDGWWYILIDTTYITIDDINIKIDRTPNI